MKNSKILLICPHEDDEINIAGGVVASYKNKENIFVLYTTNGDFLIDAKYRYKEAIKSLKQMGIEKNNVYFLGYSDQPYDQKSHMYNSNQDWTSLRGFKETYAPDGFEDWNYYKYGKHSKFNRNNFTRNIREVIEYLKPDIIICNDLDFHPDHIMTSLSFEKAMGEILKENENYYPKVLKTFTYENSYLGEDDFFNYKNNYVKFKVDKNGRLVNNPYYKLENRIEVPISKECYTYDLSKNVIWKAIKCHKSQVLTFHATRIINKNYIYWERNTKNLLNKAKIDVSSGNKEYLTDFILCDTSNVLNGNKCDIQYDAGIWIPENNDDKKEINIGFQKMMHVDLIKIYNGREKNENIRKILITINGTSKDVTLKDEFINIIEVGQDVKTINIKVLDEKCYNGFSEIEVIEYKEENNFKIFDKVHKDNGKDNKKILKSIDKLIIKLNIFWDKVYRKIFIR